MVPRTRDQRVRLCRVALDGLRQVVREIGELDRRLRVVVEGNVGDEVGRGIALRLARLDVALLHHDIEVQLLDSLDFVKVVKQIET